MLERNYRTSKNAETPGKDAAKMRRKTSEQAVARHSLTTLWLPTRRSESTGSPDCPKFRKANPWKSRSNWSSLDRPAVLRLTQPAKDTDSTEQRPGTALRHYGCPHVARSVPDRLTVLNSGPSTPRKVEASGPRLTGLPFYSPRRTLTLRNYDRKPRDTLPAGRQWNRSTTSFLSQSTRQLYNASPCQP
jgi:hypothetical protein